MFLMETDTRHSLLTKKKHFRERMPAPMQSNASRLIRENGSPPTSLDDPEFQAIRVEDSDNEEVFNLAEIPSAEDSHTGKRDRDDDGDEEYTGASGRDATDAIDVEEDGLFVPPSKRRRDGGLGSDSDEDDEDKDKKKLAMDVSYEGFAIYGRVLCLVVKKRQAKATGSGAGGQAQMENWIASTQVPVGQDE